MQKEPVDQGKILLSLTQVLITPHVAGATDITLKGMADYAEWLLSNLQQDKNRRCWSTIRRSLITVISAANPKSGIRDILRRKGCEMKLSI